MKKGFCHHCAGELEYPEKVFRNDTCPSCGSDVYCCLNCVDYDESSANRCKETQAERVTVKDRRNFCDYFRLKDAQSASRSADKAAEARKKLEALFKK